MKKTIIILLNVNLQLQSLEEGSEASGGGDDSASGGGGDVKIDRKESPAPPSTGMSEKTTSMEDIAKKKQQNRLSGSGLKTPSIGKSKDQDLTIAFLIYSNLNYKFHLIFLFIIFSSFTSIHFGFFYDEL